MAQVFQNFAKMLKFRQIWSRWLARSTGVIDTCRQSKIELLLFFSYFISFLYLLLIHLPNRSGICLNHPTLFETQFCFTNSGVIVTRQFSNWYDSRIVIYNRDTFPRGHGFKSWRHILDGLDIFTFICCKKVYALFVCLKRPKINEKEDGIGPFFKKTSACMYSPQCSKSFQFQKTRLWQKNSKGC